MHLISYFGGDLVLFETRFSLAIHATPPLQIRLYFVDVCSIGEGARQQRRAASSSAKD